MKVIALTVAGLMAIATPAAAQAHWMREIQHGPWTLASLADKALVFVRDPRRTKDGFVRAWVRTEFAPGYIPDTLSTASMVEIDCHERRFRVLQVTLYEARNLNGTSTTGPVPPTWQFIIPETTYDGLAREVCKD